MPGTLACVLPCFIPSSTQLLPRGLKLLPSRAELPCQLINFHLRLIVCSLLHPARALYQVMFQIHELLKLALVMLHEIQDTLVDLTVSGAENAASSSTRQAN